VNATPEPMSREQQLRLLTIFHYIVGAIVGLFSCFPLIHFTLGLAMAFRPDLLPGKPGQQPPAIAGWFFIILGGGMFFTGEALAACIIASGRFLSRRKHYMFIFVIACCECMFMPFGTVLGIFTIIALSKPTVKEVFDPSLVSSDATRTV
jgi:hypothetical protein